MSNIHEECGVFGVIGPFGADSLGYLPVSKLHSLIGGCGYCSACFDGDYPTAVPTDTRKDRFEQKLSEKERLRGKNC